MLKLRSVRRARQAGGERTRHHDARRLQALFGRCSATRGDQHRDRRRDRAAVRPDSGRRAPISRQVGRTSRSSTASLPASTQRIWRAATPSATGSPPPESTSTASEVLGKTAEDIMDVPALRVRFGRPTSAPWKDGKANYELVIGRRTYLDRKSALYTHDGKVRGVCGVSVGITEHTRSSTPARSMVLERARDARPHHRSEPLLASRPCSTRR